MATYPYRSNKQFEKYIGQFMRALSGFQVQDGVEREGSYNTKKVPVVYETMDRIVASIMSNRNNLPTATLPIIGVNLQGVTLDKEERKSKTHVMYTSSKPETDTDEMVESIFGPPVIMEFEASVMASSKSELFEIVEQILLVFNPRLSLLLDDSKRNPNFITEIALTGIGDEINNPIATEPQSCVMDFTFEVPVRLSYPHRRGNNIINEIIASVKQEGTGVLFYTETIDAN